MTTPELLAFIDHTLDDMGQNPHVGDHYVGAAVVYEVTNLLPIEDVWGHPSTKVVLANPLAGELHLPMDAFTHMVAIGTLTPEK